MILFYSFKIGVEVRGDGYELLETGHGSVFLSVNARLGYRRASSSPKLELHEIANGLMWIL